MTTLYRSLRVLTPAMSETKPSVRGFHGKTSASTDLLETVGRVFLTGRARAHDYMVHVGIGWAPARVPGFRWSAVTANVTDELVQWLVLDGYGFHQAYFHPDRYVRGQYRERRFPWPAGGPGWYVDRAIDQGIGRALWFVAGTDPAVAADLIDGFAPDRRADLYSGAGLAATYAGGVERHELELLWARAGEHRPLVAQAAAFAATARVRAGLAVPHNELATRVFCGMSVAEASEVSVRTRPSGPVGGDVPAYEVWRQRIADEFRASGRA
ncbi:uncharacterized protein DUF1702 [Saccharothrix saharensis]|uniref:Uncharacterized protein DUF1702 n=1 Tax=Saccharothrix saharensis TaxID=571190 RepID=A0A543JNN5_9PSEU|nr:DUF1702 family protein [Saccharothrix saharensis]TQM84385.1 uncharacterized protein DUF1702 [Saccharothrix saharensis]